MNFVGKKEKNVGKKNASCTNGFAVAKLPEQDETKYLALGDGRNIILHQVRMYHVCCSGRTRVNSCDKSDRLGGSDHLTSLIGWLRKQNWTSHCTRVNGEPHHYTRVPDECIMILVSLIMIIIPYHPGHPLQHKVTVSVA